MPPVECPSSGTLAPIGWDADPAGWWICLGLAVVFSGIAAWRRLPDTCRALSFVAGQVILLTAPIAAHIDRFVIGRFPTTDKLGSLAFYLDGAHRRLVLDPAGSLEDPAARLIGVHMGHLWVTEFFDLVLSPEGAMNLQAFLYPILAWACAALLFREVGARTDWALLMGFPFGMGLHVFRDWNCYTVEKAAIFWIPLFLWSLHRAHRGRKGWALWTALVYVAMCSMNLYLGAIGAVTAGCLCAPAIFAWMRDRLKARENPAPSGALLALGACIAAALPLLYWQSLLGSGTCALGSPAAFLERARLDRVSLRPLEWNRMPWWAALSPVALALVGLGIRRSWPHPLVRTSLGAVLVLTLLSLGPDIGQWSNPLDGFAREYVPGFWRTSEPESFFHGAWLLLLGVGALGCSRLDWSRRVVGALYLLMVATWLGLVRQSPEYPSMSYTTEVSLPADWSARAFPVPPEELDCHN